MKTLMFYSYKGGSGRTVAAANVAAAFAKLGKKTAIIDLDFEAPGLHEVFGLPPSSFGIQSYLKSDLNYEELIGSSVDILAGIRFNREAIPESARLQYIPASPGVTLLDASDPEVSARMKTLQDELRNEGTEILVIDAASGIREAFSIAYDVCDKMVIFFRWSRQHVAGTVKAADYLKRLARMGPELSRPYVVVASASPRQQEIDTLEDDGLRKELTLVKGLAKDTIRAKLTEAGVTPNDIFFEIPEILPMKWRESVVVFEEEVTPYDELAARLLQEFEL